MVKKWDKTSHFFNFCGYFPTTKIMNLGNHVERKQCRKIKYLFMIHRKPSFPSTRPSNKRRLNIWTNSDTSRIILKTQQKGHKIYILRCNLQTSLRLLEVWIFNFDAFLTTRSFNIKDDDIMKIEPTVGGYQPYI